MAGIGTLAAWMAGSAAALLLLVPAPARACEHHQAKSAAEAQVAAEAKQASPKKPGPVVAETCSCDGPGTCTCKKGQCKCKKCNGGAKYKVFDSLREQPEYRQVKLRRNASAGAFI